MLDNLTPIQQKAVLEKGNVLVAAAAGSGKTTVLVERVINRLIGENSVPADRLLIVTFTNAAAAEMFSRIEKRLNDEYKKNPHNRKIIEQLRLLPSAKICTIDSFCIDLVRENFEKLHIAPDFKMDDGGHINAINESVLAEIMGRYYDENDPVFFDLLDIIGSEYDDSDFKNFVLSLYNYSRNLAFPREWYNFLSEEYKNREFSNESPVISLAFSDAKELALDMASALKITRNVISPNLDVAEFYLEMLSGCETAVNGIIENAEAKNWNGIYRIISQYEEPKFTKKAIIAETDEAEFFKNTAKMITSVFGDLNTIFYADEGYISKQYKKLAKPMELLTSILLELDEKIWQKCFEENVFTFHHTEHLALKLLAINDGDKIEINPEADEILNSYDEVMVDEFQDTNDLQNMIFYCISNREEKLFVVGDVKQSIYRFRGANPDNFLEKKNNYIPLEESKENDAKKIILSDNFRCKPEACEFINYFFKMFMNENTGKIVYNDEERLNPAAEFPNTDKIPVEIDIIDKSESDDSLIILEAKRIADYILSAINEGEIIRASKTELRPAKFSDFAVIMRSPKRKAPIIAEVLKQAGIPVSFAGESFIDSMEIIFMMNLLKVIDNPISDIELLSVMMSPVFNFTPEEMALIRAKKPFGTLNSAVVNFRDDSLKVAQFLDKLSYFRLLHSSMAFDKFILALLDETSYLDYVSIYPDGAQKRNNLLLLASLAKDFSAEASISIPTFLKKLEKFNNSSNKDAVCDTSNTVKIMSIHASKGLQYPICIIASTATAFSIEEKKSNSVYSAQTGLGLRYYDEEKREILTTPVREITLLRNRSADNEEEMRMLYVAMTRMQDRLVIISAPSNPEKKLSTLYDMLIASRQKITKLMFSSLKSFSDWLLTSLLLHPDGVELRKPGHKLLLSDTKSRISVKLFYPGIEENVAVAEDKETIIDEDMLNKLIDNFSYSYPYSDIQGVMAKASVSALANSAESAKFAFTQIPDFMNKTLKPTARGTATHKVMEHFDFENANNVEAELDRLYEWQFISEAQREAVDVDAIRKFFASDLFKRIKNADLVKREMRFITEESANKFAQIKNEHLEDEKIIIQGAVDLCFIENGEIVLLDFKTDRVEKADELKEAYSEQLNIYAKAVEKIFEKKVKERIIYSFNLNKEIKL